jgi:hypothetical protein
MSAPTPQTNNNFNSPANTPLNTPLTVTANSNAVTRSGDMSLWDTVANKFVTPEQTNAIKGGVCTGSSTNTNYPNQ